MRHVARADVAGEDFFARHLRGGVDTVFQRAVTAVPIRPRQQLLFEQRCKRSAAERREVHRNSSDHARAQHLPARRAKWDHGCPLGRRSPSSADIIRAGREDRSACGVIRNAFSRRDDDDGSQVFSPRDFNTGDGFRQARATRTRRPYRNRFRCRCAAVNQCGKRGAALALTPSNIGSATPMFQHTAAGDQR